MLYDLSYTIRINGSCLRIAIISENYDELPNKGVGDKLGKNYVIEFAYVGNND